MRRCAVCDGPADGDCSANFARVVWFCVEHSKRFHDGPAFRLAQLARATADVWWLIDAWLVVERAELSNPRRSDAINE